MVNACTWAEIRIYNIEISIANIRSGFQIIPRNKIISIIVYVFIFIKIPPFGAKQDQNPNEEYLKQRKLSRLRQAATFNLEMDDQSNLK